jgi:diaminopimelate epimerase
MKIPFYKYQGTGNDFVMIDNRQNIFDRTNRSFVASLCHRRFGIGADGLILLTKHHSYDFEMVYFNSDGNESTMCGNGGRCLVKFAHDLGVIGEETTFLAVDGPHKAYVKNGLVHLHMIDVEQMNIQPEYYFLNTGSPHYVQAVQGIDDFNVFEKGREIRYSAQFQPGGTNVNFMEEINGVLKVRTYERGVEDETYSCGTGVTAAAIASSKMGMKPPVAIMTLGGPLQVNYEVDASGKYFNVYLIGPAERVFEGQIELKDSFNH